MKTLSFTPIADRIAASLMLLLLTFVLCCSPAFAQDSEQNDSIVAGRSIRLDTATPKMSPFQARCLYAHNHEISQSDTINVVVVRVIDGDTFIAVTCFECNDPLSIRVLGIDTPEKDNRPRKQLEKQSRRLGVSKEDVILAGKLITREADKFLTGKVVKLIRDRRELNLDRFCRPLRHVRLPDGTSYADWVRSKDYDTKK